MDKELRPLYLKRRMQLIKAAEDEYEASQLGQVCSMYSVTLVVWNKVLLT